MVKKASCVLITVLFIVSTGFCKITATFKGLGGGGQGILVYHENDFGRDGLTGGFGLRGIVEFQLGNFGLLQYTPSLTFWFTHYDKKDFSINPGYYIEYDQREVQTALNLFDVKYMFNTSKSNFKPYAGISVLPCLLINRHHDKYYRKDKATDEIQVTHDEPETSPSIGFNAFGGIDFPIKDRVIPFIEVRFTATKEWAFKTIGGMTLWF